MTVIALVVGELTAYLRVNKDDYRRGIQEARGDLDSLARDADRQATATDNRSSRMVASAASAMATVGRDADKQGRDAGGKLSQGISQGIIRNSPLIVAGVSGALAAGAPVAIAGATALFAGIGIVAAAQSKEVQKSWTDTWAWIQEGAIEAAKPIEGVLISLAQNVSDRFDKIMPQLGRAFDAVAPQIQVFGDGVLNLAENALPGMFRAVEHGMPVTQGLATMLAQVGTGVSDFFDRISSHGPAAGQVFDSLGGIIGSLLPILGELLGRGVDLASIVLPPLASALGVVADVLGALGPLLPGVVAGFTAMKVAQAASGWLTGLSTSLTGVSQNLAFASYNGGAFAGAAGKMSTASSGMASSLGNVASNVSKASLALPALGIVIAGIGSQHEKASAQEEKWAQAILAGGKASSDAFKEYQSGTHWGQSIDEATGQAAAWSDAKARADELRDAMTPLQRAHSDLTAAVQQYGSASPQAAAAAQTLTAAEKDQAKADGDLEMAISGVTQAMIDQTNQALSAIDSGFAYQDSINQLEDAQTTYNEAVRDHGAASEEAQRAMLGLQQQGYEVAKSYGQQQADLSGLQQGTDAYTRYVQEQTLAKLYDLKSAAGPEMQASLQQQIGALEASGVALSSTTQAAMTTASRIRDLGLAVTQVPGQRFVKIDAPTAQQQADIANLGYKILTLPDGQTVVYSDTGPARRELANFINTRTVKTVQVFLQNIVGGGATGGQVGEISQRGNALKRSMGGRLQGPGTPTSDSLPARTTSGRDVLFSDDEWVINAAVSRQQGDGRMGALNAGRADIVMRDRPVRGLAGGGAVSQLNSASGSGQTSRSVVIQGGVTVRIDTPLNLMNDRDIRRAGLKIRDVIVDLEREHR